MLAMGTVQEFRERRNNLKVFGEIAISDISNDETPSSEDETCSSKDEISSPQTRDNQEKVEDCTKEDLLQVYVMFYNLRFLRHYSETLF